MPSRSILVIGASAGGIEPVRQILGGLPPSLQVAVFVVIHTSSASSGVLPGLLDRAGPLRVAYPRHGEPVEVGRVYLAPPDRHLLVNDGHVSLSRGPKENGFRPAIDPLFRSAAESYRTAVLGVVLSGGMDDGTAGLWMIKKRGGLAIVQDPKTAEHPSMPTNAIRTVKVDYVLPASEMPAMIASLASSKGGRAMPKGQQRRPDIIENADLAPAEEALPGPPSGFVCPECGGALWELHNGKLVQFRCHVGHILSAESLLSENGRTLERALWTALRALDEHAALKRRMADRFAGGPMSRYAADYRRQAEDADQRAALLRQVLMAEQVPKAAQPAGAPESALSRKVSTGLNKRRRHKRAA